ncbi:MAG: hypothetical protein AB1304_06960 [Bacteroidota bacterium]
MNQLKFLLTLLILITSNIYSQNNNDYQFYKFRQRRILLANWQINQLADSGALIVRLKSNRKVIEMLKAQQKLKTAKEVELSTYSENKKIVSAFARNYKFSKLYFMYDYSSDSLLKGFRKGFFLDTNLNRNPDIELKEKFYLIAERGSLVESHLGLIPDSLATKVSESGPTSKEVAIIVKNKYGIQLKHPFPYYVNGMNINKYDIYVTKFANKLNKFKQKSPRVEYPLDLRSYMY